MKLSSFWIVTILLISASDLYSQTTYAEKSLRQDNQLFRPERITIGPSDNFQPSLGEQLFYTKNTHLAVRIFEQEVSTGRTRAYLRESVDSRDPALRGEWLAFTSFERDARGDICVLRSGGSPLCRFDRSFEENSPFWINSNWLGYLRRKEVQSEFEIVAIPIANFESAQPSLMTRGRITDPSLTPSRYKGRQYLAYTKIESNHRRIELQELQLKDQPALVGPIHQLNLAIPGYSGFAEFSRDSETLYFAQYAIDTNNDLEINGRDHSAIFRVSMSQILSGELLYPEPLSSVDHNCNDPSPADDLYMTCASDSLVLDRSLDVFRLPLSGMIPVDWGIEDLNRAIQTSRSYNDRNLMHLALLARFPSSRNAESFKRILSNNLMEGQLTTALFYIARIQSLEPEDPFFDILKALVEVQLEYEKLPQGLVTPSFSRFVQKRLREDLSKHKSAWSQMVQSYLQFYLGERVEARRLLKSLKVENFKNQLSQYYYFEARKLFEPKARLQALFQAAQTKRFSEQARVYYAYESLRASDQIHGLGSELQNSNLQSMRSQVKDPQLAVAQLLEFQILLNNIRSDDVKDKSNRKAYSKLLKFVSSAKDRYFLQRALLTRAVLFFSRKNYWNYMSFFSSRWVSISAERDSEYSYARSQFLEIGLEKAYGYWNSNKSFAGDQFSITSRLTDDLEAHHGFIQSRWIEDRKSEIDEIYESLKTNNFIAENMIYVEVLIDFLSLKPEERSLDQIQSLARRLESMNPRGFKPAVQLYFLAYLEHQIYQLKLSKAEDDLGVFQQAHRHYMLALDLSSRNERLIPGILFNLGHLHLLALNYGEALNFFELRKTYGFDKIEQRASFVWFASQAYFGSGQSRKAFTGLKSFLSEVKTREAFLPFYEKAGFYAIQSKLYSEALSYYRSFIERAKPWIQKHEKHIDWIRIQTAYGFALFKQKQFKEARKIFNGILQATDIVNPERRVGQFLPLEHFQLIANGFMSQMIESSEKLRFLEARRDLLKKYEDNLHAILLRREDWLRQMAKVQQQLATLYFQKNEDQKALELMKKSFSSLNELAETTLNPLDSDFVKGLTNIWRTQSLSDQFAVKAQEWNTKIKNRLQEAPEIQKIEPYRTYLRQAPS